MADVKGSEQIKGNMFSVQEEENDLQIVEEGDRKLNLSHDESAVGRMLQEEDKLKVSLSGLSFCDSGNKELHHFSTPVSELDLDDFSKNVRFFHDSEVLNSSGNNVASVRVFDPVTHLHLQETETQNNEDMSISPTEQQALSPGNCVTGSHRNNVCSLPGLPNSLPPLQTSTDESASATLTTLQKDEPTGRRHFEVLNVDESVLKANNDNDNDEKENNIEPDFENKPLLEKRSSSYSDSDQSTHNTYFDTIGPLENPVFLKMLNYSVSRVTQDDGYGRMSNLDLDNFTGTETLSDMDGGWAWVVLFAAFFSLSLTGATAFSAGVLMSAILEKIDNDITKASWIGAVHISVLCMSGPFVGVVLNRLGAKCTAFIAGIVLSFGLIGAWFSASVLHLIFTHGLIAGMGSGFILNTMFVTVGQYFNRYRGIACGLLATGSGLGMLAGGNALTALLNIFGLHGTYLIWSGVTLHSLVFAMLLRPSPAERQREAEKLKAKKLARNKGRNFQGSGRSLRSGTNSIYSARTNSFKKNQKYTGKQDQQDQGVAPLLKSVLHKDSFKSTHSVTASQSAKPHRKSNLSITTTTPGTQSKLSSQSNIAADQQSIRAPSGSYSKDKMNQLPPNPSNSSTEATDRSEPSSPKNLSSPTQNLTPADNSFRKRLISGSSQAPSHYTSESRLSYRPSIREQLQQNDLDNESLASTLVSHLRPQDALTPRYRLGSRSVSSMVGSIASLPTALVIIKDDLSQIDTPDGPKKKQKDDEPIGLMDSMGPLKNKPFLVFISTCLLWALGDSPFSMYLPAYTMSKGSTGFQASSLYTAMGFGSMCGRFLSGLVASDGSVGPVLLHIGCLSVASVLVGVSPWITSTYVEQLICSGLFGLYTGSLVPLTSLITIELLGIGDLGVGFGFLSMAQGIGYLAGPPLMGFIIKALGYERGFNISGLILISASFLAMMITVFIKKDKEEEGIHDSFDDLEKALHRISDTELEEDSEDIVSYQDVDQSYSPTATEAYQFSALKKKDEQGSLQDHALSRDGSGDHEERLKVTPSSPASPTAANDLGMISEER